MSATPESGLRNHRTEFVRETTNAQGDPQTPTDPSFERPSDRVYNIEWSPTPALQADRGLGDADVDEHDKGPEEHEITVAYALQKWFVDGSGSPDDLAGDGLIRNSDNQLPNSHTFVDREDKGSIAAVSTVEAKENGVGSATSKGSRTYIVGRGGKVADVTVTVDPGDSQPAQVEVTYMCEKSRKFQIDQPNSSTELTVKSTDSNDTSQTVTIEDEGASTSNDVSLNGNTVESTTDTFGDIDAIELDSETDGDVIVSINDGTTSSPTEGETIAVLRGSASYEDIEGDTGVPTLGAGSHSSTVGTDYLRTLTDTITFAGSSDYWFEINSKELSVDNNVETRPRDDSVRQRVQEGARNTEMSVTSYGETQSATQAREALENTGADIVWTFPNAPTGNGTITLGTAKLTGPGSHTSEAEQTQMTLDDTFVPEGGGTSGLTIG